MKGSRIGGVPFAGGYAGDWVSQPEPGRVQFGASTDGYNLQSITLASASEPRRFTLYVDGYPATYAVGPAACRLGITWQQSTRPSVPAYCCAVPTQ